MAHDTTIIANRYVDALFDLAEKGNQQEQIKHDLVTLEWVIAENKAFQKLLVSPIVSKATAEKIITALLDTMQASALTKQFFTVLIHQRRLPVLRAIINSYLAKLAEARGELAVDLVSAHALTPEQKEMFSTAIAQATGKKVGLRVSENPALLGGVQLKIGSRIFDDSIATKLNRLKNELKKAA